MNNEKVPRGVSELILAAVSFAALVVLVLSGRGWEMYPAVFALGLTSGWMVRSGMAALSGREVV